MMAWKELVIGIVLGAVMFYAWNYNEIVSQKTQSAVEIANYRGQFSVLKEMCPQGAQALAKVEQEAKAQQHPGK